MEKRNKQRLVTLFGICIIILAAAFFTLQFKEARVFINRATRFITPFDWVPFPADDVNAASPDLNFPPSPDQNEGTSPAPSQREEAEPPAMPSEADEGDEGSGEEGGEEQPVPPGDDGEENGSTDNGTPGDSGNVSSGFEFPDGAVFPSAYLGEWEGYSVLESGGALHLILSFSPGGDFGLVKESLQESEVPSDGPVTDPGINMGSGMEGGFDVPDYWWAMGYGAGSADLYIYYGPNLTETYSSELSGDFLSLDGTSFRKIQS